MGSHYIGGKFTNVVTTNYMREINIMDVDRLNSYLRSNGIPENKIREAQKIKVAI
jgi:hypothetical protein